MKLLLINEVCGTGSTGKICAKIAEEYEEKGYICKIAYGRNGFVPDQYKKYAVRIGNDFGVKLHALSTRLFDNTGFCSSFATKQFLKWADRFDPDVLWLHNLHGYYINVELLFNWIKSRPNMKVKWTLHDCWAFTGHCTHFTVMKCYKWRKQCVNCPQKSEYPKSVLFDNSYLNFKRKRRAFTGVKNLTIIVPSKWLANLVKKSFLRKYPLEVHYNTIDLSVFKPTESDFRKKKGLENNIIILGVSNVWNERKGYYDFIKLSKMLDDNYRIVLVGLNKKQMKEIPSKIIGIKRTNTQKELAAIYSTADVFLNLSREETFGMTSMESLLCGTVPIVLKETACEEIVKNNKGYILDYDLDIIKKFIESMYKKCE